MRELRMADLIENSIRWYEREGKVRYARTVWRRWGQHLEPFFGEVAPDKLTTRLQEEYRAMRTKAGAKNATINRETQILRRAYKLAAQQEPPLVTREPRFIQTKENNARKVFIDMGTLGKIRELAAQHSLWLRIAIEMAYTYGWRRGELAALYVSDIDLFEGTIRLRTSKNGDAREVPITDALRPHLQTLVDGRAGDTRLLRSANRISACWREVFNAAGASDKRLHDLRRTSARVKRSAGVPTSVIMEMQGWKSEAMFRRYAIVDRQDKVDALKKQAEWEARMGAR